MSTYFLKIYRGTPEKQYWETFALPRGPGENVISGLMEIQKRPITADGRRVAPVVWESACLEEVCGSCSMLINGKPRQACTALIEELAPGDEPIVLAPLTKFPLVRDLIVDRSSMFENLKRIHGWIEEEAGEGFGPTVSQEKQEVMYSLSTCMTCGCCLEACPQVNAQSDFVGPAAISQARLFNAHPTGSRERAERLRPLMERGGVSDCGHAQNCVKVCPKKIPLTDSIAAVSRDVTLQAFRDLFTSHPS